MERLYGKLNMTWCRVILFAVIAGVYTGLVMLVPFFHDTSFQDIGIFYEWWVIFAVIIVVNCKKGTEAMMKCFVFFLISQPLIFLVEMAFGSLSFEMAWKHFYYNWFPIILLTLPGGFLAYFCKKQNAFGGSILGIGNAIQAVMAVCYFTMAVRRFPFHLLSGIVCVASIIIMTVYIQKKNRNRLITLLVTAALTVLILVLAKATGRVIIS